ncbi:MAG: alpha/beta hydrolase [Pseudomonadota bacterium]|nr:alpha/beta hydrolase [Pseudomonadota bacterium]
MPSIRARLLNRYLRLVMKPKRLPEIDPPALREWVEKRALPLYPKDVSRETVESPVRGEWHRPHAITGDATILYLHGGGYVFGSVRLYRPLTMALAAKTGCEVFSAEYRLAPEHRCPAAIDDALAAYDWLIASGRDPKRIVLGGDSAGGGLCLAAMMALRDRGAPTPAGAFLYSPWTDLATTGASIDANADSDAMFQRYSIVNGPGHYVGALDRKDPRVSPLYGDLKGLPPLLVFASASEMLFDDAARLAEKAAQAGVGVRFEPRPGLAHAWPIFHPVIPEAKETVALTADFVRGRTAKG